jgi:hypothetical protein
MARGEKNKRTNNDLQNITHKTKDRVTQTTPETGGELRYFGRVSSSCSTFGRNSPCASKLAVYIFN